MGIRFFRSCALLLFLSFLSIKDCFAQQNKVDSLLRIVSEGKKDSCTASALNSLANLFIYKDIAKAQQYSDTALALALQTNCPFQVAEALNNKGVISLNQNNYRLANLYLHGANKLFVVLKNKNGETRVQSNIGILYDLQGEYDTALVYYRRALALNTEAGNNRGIGYSFNNIGAVYHIRSDYPNALHYYLLGLQAREKARDATGMSGSYTNIGMVYLDLADYGKAQSYLQKAIDIVEKQKDKLTAATLYSSIGLCYSKKGKQTLAENFYRKALALAIENGDKYATLLNMNSLAENFMNGQQYDSSLTYSRTSLALSKEINSPVDIGINLNNIAFVLFQKKDFKAAIQENKVAMGIAVRTKEQSLLSKILGDLSRCYENMGKTKEALAYYKNHIAVRDSIFNEENTKKTVRSEMNFEFERKEAMAKAEQEKKEAIALTEKRKQRVVLGIVTCFLVLVAGFGVYAYRSYLEKKRSNEEITKQKHLIEEKQKEILDSIYYARRIQRSLLPTKKYIAKLLRRAKENKAL